VKKLLFLCSLSFFIFCCLGASSQAASPIKVDVLFMNHGPLMDTLNKMKGVFSGYGDKLSVSWYDFDAKEGEEFMTKKGVKQHVPLIVWINGSPVVAIGGARKVQFTGFPTGSGPASFQGKWTMDDLKAALDQATAGK